MANSINSPKGTTKLVALIILVVVLIIMFSVLVPELDEAGNQLNESNQCNSRASCTFNETNSTTSPCRDAVNQSASCSAGGNQSVPLSVIFSGTVMLLIVMAVLLFVVIKAFSMKKN